MIFELFAGGGIFFTFCLYFLELLSAPPFPCALAGNHSLTLLSELLIKDLANDLQKVLSGVNIS